MAPPLLCTAQRTCRRQHVVPPLPASPALPPCPDPGVPSPSPATAASQAVFWSTAKYMVGFAIDAAGTKDVARWGSLNWAVGPG